MASTTKQPVVAGLWGVRYQVKDVQRSISFYTETLGFKLGAGGATFRYRLLILSRHATPAELEAEYKEWAKQGG